MQLKYVFIIVYREMNEALKKHPDASVMVSFASLRSAYESTLEALKYSQVKRSFISSAIV